MSAAACAERATVAVRDARPADNDALVALAAASPMAGDVTMCVDRAPDFFALARLVYRNFVGWTELPAWCERIVPDRALGERLIAEDRSLMQRRVVACRLEAA